MNDCKESKTVTEVTVTIHPRKQINWNQMQNKRSEDRFSNLHVWNKRISLVFYYH